MNRIIKSLVLVLTIAVGCHSAKSQDTPENRYLIENSILSYYYRRLCSEQGSLASFEQVEEFRRRKFTEQDFREILEPLNHSLKTDIAIFNKRLGRNDGETELMWGDMSDAEYFTLHFDEIKFSYPHMATVTATIDYGVRKIVKSYAMHRWNDIWWIDDVTLSTDPTRWLSDWLLRGDNEGADKSEGVDKSVVKEKESSSDQKTDKPIYNIAFVDEQPEFPGGAEAMYNWIAANIQYPAGALAEGVQGRVIVEIVVDESGNIKNPRVLRGRHPELDKEALRVVNSMPTWKPARVKGEAVSTCSTLPVAFKIRQ